MPRKTDALLDGTTLPQPNHSKAPKQTHHKPRSRNRYTFVDVIKKPLSWIRGATAGAAHSPPQILRVKLRSLLLAALLHSAAHAQDPHRSLPLPSFPAAPPRVEPCVPQPLPIPAWPDAGVQAAPSIGNPALAIPPKPAETGEAASLQVEQAVLARVNAQRLLLGLTPLRLRPQLARAARQHSQEMLALNYFSHLSPTDGYRTLHDRLAASSCYEIAAGENLFMAQNLPMEQLAEQSVDSWMHSEGHRRNLLNPEFTCMGLAVAQNGPECSVTQVLSRPYLEISNYVARPEDSGYSVHVEGVVVEGPGRGALFLDDRRVLVWEADSEHRFKFDCHIEAGQQLTLAQAESERRWSLNTRLPLPPAAPR